MKHDRNCFNHPHERKPMWSHASCYFHREILGHSACLRIEDIINLLFSIYKVEKVKKVSKL